MGKTPPNHSLDAHPRGRSSLGSFSDPSAGTLPAHSPWKNFFPAELRDSGTKLASHLRLDSASFLPQTQHQRRQLAGHAQAQQRRVASCCTRRSYTP